MTLRRTRSAQITRSPAHSLTPRLVEPKSGIFLGNPSKRVRDELWKLATAKAKQGTVMQIWSERCPQGYRFRTHGDPDRQLVDLEGIALVRKKRKVDTGAKQAAGPPTEDATTP